MRLRGGDFQLKNAFGRRIRWKSPPHSRILFGSPKTVHRPRSDLPLHLNIRNIFVWTKILLVILAIRSPTVASREIETGK